MAILYVQSNTLYLAGSGVVIGATSVVLTSLTDIYGNVLTMTDFGSKGYITLEPDTTNEEAAIFTGITANTNGTYTLTGVKTILAKSPYTEGGSGLVRGHAGGTKVVITDNVAFWDTFVNKNNASTISAIYTFSAGATPVITDAPVNPTDAANKAYIDGIAIAGSPDSTTTVKGIGKVSVAPVSPTSPIFVGDNDGRVPTQGENDALVGNNTDVAVGSGNKFVTQTGLQHNAEKYAADAQANDTYVITLSPAPTSYTNGMVVLFKANTANTGAATINVNGLGAISIVTGLSTALATGDILANQICHLVYNSTGTVFELMNPASAYLFTPIVNNGIITRAFATASGAVTTAHGLGRIPKLVTFSAKFAKTGQDIATSTGSYNGSTNSNSALLFDANGNVNTVTSDTTNAVSITFGTSGADSQKAVATFDATNITLTWTKAGTSTTGNIEIDWVAWS